MTDLSQKQSFVGSTPIQIYTEDFYYPDDETGYNPDIIVDTFNEPPQFSYDKEIVLSDGQTEVVFSDNNGDWYPISIEYYASD